MKIKIFGERNTSTNALKQMIAQNSESILHPGGIRDFSVAQRGVVSLVDKVGFPTSYVEKLKDRLFESKPLVHQWKHCATNFTDADRCVGTHFVFVVRHPASWILSLKKNPYQSLQDNSGSLEGFMEQEWKTVGREMLGGRTYRPLQLYKEKITSYMRFMKVLDSVPLTYSLIRFEDMILNQKQCFDQLSPYLDSPNSLFAEVKGSTKDSQKDLDYYKNYYGNEKWREELGVVFTSNASFDSNLLSWMGYEW